MARFSALISAFIGLLFTTLVWADALPTAKPEEVGLSSERLARATQVLKAEVARGQYPGAVVLVARKGKIAYFESVGQRDPQAGAPMPRFDPDTGRAVYALVPAERQMTVQDLLRHTSGLAYGGFTNHAQVKFGSRWSWCS